MFNCFLFMFCIVKASVEAPSIVGHLRLSSRFGFHDPSIVHVRNGIGVMKYTGVMGNDDDGPGRIDGVVSKQVHHGFASSVVERSRGLIAKDQPWFMHERASQCNTLLLTTGEFARQRVQTLLQAKFYE
jgi:hypothetical protein